MKDKQNSKKMTLKDTVSHFWYLFKISYAASPATFWVDMGFTVFNATATFTSGAYLLRYMVNGFQAGKTFADMIWYIVAMFSIMLVMGIARVLYDNLLTYNLGIKQARAMYGRLYRKCTEIDLACYEQPAFYEKLTKVYEEGAWRIYNMRWRVQELVQSTITIAGTSFLILLIEPWLIFLTVIPIIASFLLGKANNKANHDYDTEASCHWRRRWNTQRTVLMKEYAKEMRSTDMADVVIGKHDIACDELIKMDKRYAFRYFLFDWLPKIIRQGITTCGAYLVAVYETVVTKTMLYGDCIVIISSIASVSDALDGLIQNFIGIHEDALYIKDVRELLETKITMDKKAGGLPVPRDCRTLDIQNVSFTYTGSEKPTLKNVTLHIGAGEKIALVGQNGAGKSTLVKLLLRFYDATEGALTLDGVNIKEYDVGQYRDYYAAVFQDVNLFSVPISENVLQRRFTEADHESVTSALQKADIYDKVKELPQGIDTPVTKEFSEDGAVLSGGESQKIAIARIYVGNSQIAILDEPSSALDPIAEYKMYETMMNACKGQSVIFISHRLSSAVLADRIYVIDGGEIVEEGSHAALMKRGGLYAEMFHKQAESYVSDGKEARA